jgi:hypothetical protein
MSALVRVLHKFTIANQISSQKANRNITDARDNLYLLYIYYYLIVQISVCRLFCPPAPKQNLTGVSMSALVRVLYKFTIANQISSQKANRNITDARDKEKVKES